MTNSDLRLLLNQIERLVDYIQSRNLLHTRVTFELQDILHVHDQLSRLTAGDPAIEDLEIRYLSIVTDNAYLRAAMHDLYIRIAEAGLQAELSEIEERGDLTNERVQFLKGEIRKLRGQFVDESDYELMVE